MDAQGAAEVAFETGLGMLLGLSVDTDCFHDSDVEPNAVGVLVDAALNDDVDNSCDAA